MSDIYLSLVIPAYNEELRIGATLTDSLAYFDAQPYDAEIIVVDDGSSDRTVEVVREGFPTVKLVSYPDNRGKGYAVKEGMLSAVGRYRLFYDADSSTPISELEKVWPLVEKGADIVIGSRAMPESDLAIRQPWYRQNMGRSYNLLLRLLGLTTFSDTQCGFKVMNAASTEAVIPLITRDGYGMDCEMLCIAKHFGYTIGQVPVRWLNSEDSRVHPIFDSLDMIREVLIVRWRLLRGRYTKPDGA